MYVTWDTSYLYHFFDVCKLSIGNAVIIGILIFTFLVAICLIVAIFKHYI